MSASPSLFPGQSTLLPNGGDRPNARPGALRRRFRRFVIRATRRIQPVLLVLLMPIIFVPMLMFYLMTHLRGPGALQGDLSGYEVQYAEGGEAARPPASAERRRVVVSCRWS